MGLPMGPKSQEHLIDQDQSERFVEHETQDKKPCQHRDPTGCFFEFKAAEASDDSEQKKNDQNRLRDSELDL